MVRSAFSVAFLSVATISSYFSLTEAQCYPPADCTSWASSRYRTLDGSCNNLGPAPKRTRWGQAETCYGRFTRAYYSDYLFGDPSLPKPRVLSNVLHAYTKKEKPYTGISQMFLMWGQLVANEVAYSAVRDEDMSYRPETWSTLKDKSICTIEVPTDDPFYSRLGVKCLVRIAQELCTTCANEPKEHRNGRSSFIDLGNIYSNDPKVFKLLLTKDGLINLPDGIISTVVNSTGIFDSHGCQYRVQNYYPKDKAVCFAFADDYVNNNTWKAGLLVLLARHHNRYAKGLRALNPGWSVSKVFEEAKRIVSAQFQMITYNEWLPLFLGRTRMNMDNLNVGANWTKYNPTIDPRTMVEFAISASRIGHSIISDETFITFENGTRLSAPFRNYHVYNPGWTPNNGDPTWLDMYNRASLNEPIKNPGQYMDDAIRNFMSKVHAGGPVYGTDLISIDISRGREFGVAPYVVMRKLCFNEDIITFEQLVGKMSLLNIECLKTLYKTVDKIDFYSGGLLEYSEKGSMMGETFGCVVAEQFRRFKFGDRYWFEHKNEAGSFTECQLAEIRRVRMSHIICLNSDSLRHVQREAFRVPGKTNAFVSCDQLEKLDLNLSLWTDGQKC